MNIHANTTCEKPKLSPSVSSSDPPLVMLMAGGTGGHVFPALAIAEALHAEHIGVNWLGTAAGMEAELVPNAGIPLHTIDIQGLRGKGWQKLMTAPLQIARAVQQARHILRAHRPAVVVGMGGFASGPGGVAAKLMGIPLIIHEQNALPGLTNRWLAKIATQVLEAFPNTFSPQYNAIHTGNPLRATINALPTSAEHLNSQAVTEPLHILVLGGSLGAKALNETVPEALRLVTHPLKVKHQVGKIHAEAMENAYHNAPFSAEVTAFIADMAAAYAWADVVICRAGALTVSELAQAGVPSILIPFPHAVDDHQTHNARFLTEQGAAVLIPQATLDPAELAALLSNWAVHPNTLRAMARAAHQCAMPQATQQVVHHIKRHLPA